LISHQKWGLKNPKWTFGTASAFLFTDGMHAAEFPKAGFAVSSWDASLLSLFLNV